MPHLGSCHPRDRSELGLSPNDGCWRLAYNGREIAATTGNRAFLAFTLELIGRSIWDAWPHLGFSDWWFDVPDQDFPAEVVRARVSKSGLSVWLDWTFLGDGEQAVDLRGLFGATDAQIKALLLGRDLIEEVRHAVGRRPGSTLRTKREAWVKLGEAAVELRRKDVEIGVKSLAAESGIPETTLRRHMVALGITVADIREERWPKKPVSGVSGGAEAAPRVKLVASQTDR